MVFYFTFFCQILCFIITTRNSSESVVCALNGDKQEHEPSRAVHAVHCRRITKWHSALKEGRSQSSERQEECGWGSGMNVRTRRRPDKTDKGNDRQGWKDDHKWLTQGITFEGGVVKGFDLKWQIEGETQGKV